MAEPRSKKLELPENITAGRLEIETARVVRSLLQPIRDEEGIEVIPSSFRVNMTRKKGVIWLEARVAVREVEPEPEPEPVTTMTREKQVVEPGAFGERGGAVIGEPTPAVGVQE